MQGFTSNVHQFEAVKNNPGIGCGVDKLEENCPLIMSDFRKCGVRVLNVLPLLHSNCCIHWAYK